MNCDNDNNMTEGAQRRNPLLEEWHTPHATPPFSRIGVGDYLPAFEAAIAASRAEVAAIASNAAPATFENTVAALESQALEPTCSRNIIKLQTIDNHSLFGVCSKSKSF